MMHLLTYKEATNDVEKALAAIVVSTRKSAKARAWRWAEIALGHAQDAGVSVDDSILGSGRRPDLAGLEGAVLALKAKRKNEFRVFNASGHPLDQSGVILVGNFVTPNINTSNPAEVQAFALEIAERAAPHVRTGAWVALPGMSLLAAHVITAIHGIVGFYPRIAWAVRQDGQFVWGEAFTSDLQDFRLETRGGDAMSECPLSGRQCSGPDCAWWVEGHGLPGRCAVAQIARHHVIAGEFEEPVGDALMEATHEPRFLQLGDLVINLEMICEIIFIDDSIDDADVVILFADGQRDTLLGSAARDFRAWWEREGDWVKT